MAKNQLGDIPGAMFTAQAYTPAHAAATATEVVPIFMHPTLNVRIRKVGFIPAAAATGDNSNTTNLNLQNRGTAGSGTTELGNFDPVTGADLVAHDYKEVYAPATPADLDAGSVLAVQFEKVGTGLAIPQGQWIIEYDLNRAS